MRIVNKMGSTLKFSVQMQLENGTWLGWWKIDVPGSSYVEKNSDNSPSKPARITLHSPSEESVMVFECRTDATLELNATLTAPFIT